MTIKAITFEVVDDEIILRYQPEQISSEHLAAKLQNDGKLIVRKVFHFVLLDKIDKGEDGSDINNAIFFRFATCKDGMYFIKGAVLGMDYDVYIGRGIKLKSEYFIAHRDISIFKKLAAVVRQDIRIVSDDEYQIMVNPGSEFVGVLPISDFFKIIKEFPNSTELTRYAEKRIGLIVEDFFSAATKAIDSFEDYFSKKRTGISLKSSIAESSVWFDEYEKYLLLQKELKELLEHEQISEIEWQKKIIDFILLLFPKYIAILDEFIFKDGFVTEDKTTTRRADLILLDVDGYIDLIELKSPSKSLIRKTQYRQNHVPSGELSGSIMQLEKYIYALSSSALKQSLAIKKSNQYEKIGIDIDVKIVNPKGILIIGRSGELDTDAKKLDFELIKRKYANVMDVLTYDDLLSRLNRLVCAMRLKKGGNNESDNI